MSTSGVYADMAKANDEMAHWQEYDYIVVNRDLDDRTRTGTRRRGAAA